MKLSASDKKMPAVQYFPVITDSLSRERKHTERLLALHLATENKNGFIHDRKALAYEIQIFSQKKYNFLCKRKAESSCRIV